MHTFFDNNLFSFFNQTKNKYSKGILINILQTKLNTKDELLERQIFLKSLLQQNVSYNFYAPFDFYEAFDFCNSTPTNYTKIADSKINFYLWHFINKKESIKLEGNIKQLFTLLENMHNYVFSKLNFDALPQLIKAKLTLVMPLFDKNMVIKKYIEKFNDGKITKLYLWHCLQFFLHKETLNSITILWQVYFELEAFINIANIAKENNFVFPIVATNNILQIEEFYYPIVKNCITNSINSPFNCYVLTGPNMAGKSVLLKSISWCVWLANIGLPIPASNAKIPFYDAIAIHLNVQDDAKMGYSKFYNEILQLKHLTNKLITKQQVFCLFDELYASTNVNDATSLFTKTITKFKGLRNITCVLSTHLNFKKSESNNYDENIAFVFLEVLIKNNKPNFTYVLKNGVSNINLGQSIFNAEGLNDFFDE